MKKSTIFLLVAAAVLAVVAFLVTRKSGPDAPKKFDIPGLASDADLAAEKKLGMMDAKPALKHPIDEVILEQPADVGGTIRLVRDGEGETSKWRLAVPVDAPAQKYPVEAIIELFKTPTTRSDTRTIKAADLPLFDLEPGRRIGLTLKSKGAVWGGVDLIIGQVVKDGEPGGEESVKGTWVLVKGDETTAFLIADKDLRAPAMKSLADFRDKKAFDFEADAVSRLEIVDPTGEKVALTSVTTETPPAPDAGPDAKPTKATVWTLSEPAGVKGDTAVQQVTKNLAGLRVNEFVPLAKATDEAKKALEGKTWKLTAKVGDKDVVLTVADGAKEPIWARVEGRDEIFSLASYAANNVRKGLGELKDKTVWDVTPDAVTGLTLMGDTGPIELTKADGKWKFVLPAVAYPADATSFLGSGAKLAATRWAKKSELEAARKALATPDIRAVIMAGAASYTLSISAVLTGDDGGGGQNRWAAVVVSPAAAVAGGDSATAEPFVLADFTAKRFVTTVAALRMKKLLPKGKDDIVSLSIQLAGATEVALLEKPSTGGDLTLVTPPAGKVANDEAIRTLVATLGGLEAKTFHEGAAVAVTGLDPAKSTRVTIKGADGTTTTLLLSATSAGEGAVYAVIDQGPLANTPIGLNEYQAKNLAKSLADLVKDPAAPGGGGDEEAPLTP